jgi:ketosteroid isomerase-like protein
MANVAETAKMLFAAFERKDLAAVLALFAGDALLYDPHYPQATMKGMKAIRRGITWGMATLKQPGFTIEHVWQDGAGTSGAVEITTHHVLGNGARLNFQQMFVIELRDGLITRLQSYTPYPPPSAALSVLRAMSRLGWRLSGK